MLESTPGIPLLNPVDPVAGWFGYITPVLNMLESTPGFPLLKVGTPIVGWPFNGGWPFDPGPPTKGSPTPGNGLGTLRSNGVK